MKIINLLCYFYLTQFSFDFSCSFFLHTKKIVDVCKKHISKNQNELSENKTCSWVEVECLGACANAPMMQINQDYFEDLDENKTEEIVQSLLKDK